jgi:hypothetical protein
VVIRSPEWKPRDGDKVRGVKFPRSLLRPYVQSETYNRSHDKDFQLVTTKQESLGAEFPIPKVKLGNSQSIENNQEMSADSAAHITDTEKQRLNIVGRKVGIGLHPFGLPFMPLRHRTTLRNRTVHGVCHLPAGYCLSMLPPGTEVFGIHGPSEGLSRRPRRCWWAGHGKPEKSSELDNSAELSSSYSFSTGVITILQTLYAAFTLYKTRGDQINRYGYAAFGLTVAPYLVMSLVNLVNSILAPSYAAVYLIRNEVMAEAERREGARFEGVIGSLRNNTSDPIQSEVVFEVEADRRTIMHESKGYHAGREHMQAENNESIDAIEVDVNSNGPQDSQGQNLENNQLIEVPSGSMIMTPKQFFLPFLGAFLVGSVSIAILAILSRFKTGQSTTSQQAWTMTWLSFGICIGPMFTTASNPSPPNPDGTEPPKAWLGLAILLNVLCFVPAIGGFVVVAQMLEEYGKCIQIY